MRPWFRPTLTRKFALLFALTLLCRGGNALVIRSTLTPLSGLGETVNLGDALRWRNQQVEVDALHQIAGSEVQRTDLARRIGGIGNTIDSLANGGGLIGCAVDGARSQMASCAGKWQVR